MNGAYDAYFDALLSLLSNIRDTQRERVASVARVAAACIAQRGVIHLLDNGHFLRDELINRAGGLGIMNRLDSPADVGHPAITRRGDLIVFGSVSGRGPELIDAALLARRRGIATVGLTSLAQAQVAVPAHASGQLLKDVVDHVLDIGGIPGDGMLAIEGVSERVCPSSGIAAAAVMWALVAEVVSILAAAGTPPTIFTSVNVPGGEERYQEQLERLRAVGY